jgi:hypothetical protein
VYYGVSRVVYGGCASQYLTLLMFQDFSDLDRGHPLERALGADGLSKLQGKLTGIISLTRRLLASIMEEYWRNARGHAEYQESARSPV